MTSVGSRASPVVRSGLKVGRLPLLIGGMLALLAGVTGGLLRAGLQVPVLRADHAALHAALMIGGFFGTVVASVLLPMGERLRTVRRAARWRRP